MKRRPHSKAANAVDPARTIPDRRVQTDLQLPRWDNSKNQPRPSVSRVKANIGHVSTCNAGARASPAVVPPKRPSTPGIIHHQGRGSRPLNKATRGISTRNILNMQLFYYASWEQGSKQGSKRKGVAASAEAHMIGRKVDAELLTGAESGIPMLSGQPPTFPINIGTLRGVWWSWRDSNPLPLQCH